MPMKRVRVDKRRQAIVALDEDEAAEKCAQLFVEEAQRAIAAKSSFSVALAGGSTPAAVYRKLQEPSFALSVNWQFVNLFWGDERAVPPDSPESNFHMAQEYFSVPPLNQAKTHRMMGEAVDLDSAARDYENLIKRTCPGGKLDLILLGIGDDGHTASLFPETKALHEEKRLVVANQVPQKECTRLTVTFPCIDLASKVIVFALGRSKAKVVKKILRGDFTPDLIPAQRLGTEETPALYILDKRAAYGSGLSG